MSRKFFQHQKGKEGAFLELIKSSSRDQIVTAIHHFEIYVFFRRWQCDWTDWTNPSCRSATTPEIQSDDVQTAEDCDAMPWCTAETYQYCDETGSQTCQT